MKATRPNSVVDRPVRRDALRRHRTVSPFDQYVGHVMIIGATRSGKSVLSKGQFNNTVRRGGRGS